VLLSQLNKLLMGNAASADEDHAVSGVVVLDVVGELGSGNIADVLARAQDGAAQRLVLESSGVQVVENHLLNLLLDFLRLAKDDIALALNGRLLELGVLQDIGQDVDALRNVGVEGLGEVNCVLALSVGLVARRSGFSLKVYMHVQKCRRSGGRPCSQFRAPIAAAIAWQYPEGNVNNCLPANCPLAMVVVVP
jgi:hypothetical protein